MRPLRFGAGAKLYTFPLHLAAMTTNFGNLVPSTQRIPGLSGGFDNLGNIVAPGEIGNVQIALTLVVFNRADAEAKRDEIRRIGDWGVQRLFAQPSDPNMAERWCFARLNSMNLPERLDAHSDLWQSVSLSFQVSDPRWYSQGTEAGTWGDQITAWGQGHPWGGSAALNACAGMQTDFNITTIGTAMTKPRLFIRCATGQTAENVVIQRLTADGLQVLDEVSWTGVLVAGDALVIDGRAWAVRKNLADAYTAAFNFLHPDWFRLDPGVNKIRVKMKNAGDACTVSLRYYDTYR